MYNSVCPFCKLKCFSESGNFFICKNCPIYSLFFNCFYNIKYYKYQSNEHVYLKNYYYCFTRYNTGTSLIISKYIIQSNDNYPYKEEEIFYSEDFTSIEDLNSEEKIETLLAFG